ncbi:MAG: helix-turn-helix transcriptional regulator [Maribacter sp.]
MLDTQSFIERLSKLLSLYDLSSSAFADRIEVQRSSISHLLNGRNKPSLEFIMKVNDYFEEVDLNWLLYGKGDFPYDKKENNDSQTILKNNAPDQNITARDEKSIDSIIIFYKDGTFKNFKAS